LRRRFGFMAVLKSETEMLGHLQPLTDLRAKNNRAVY